MFETYDFRDPLSAARILERSAAREDAREDAPAASGEFLSPAPVRRGPSSPGVVARRERAAARRAAARSL